MNRTIAEKTLKTKEGWQIGSDKPMFSANYAEVNFKRSKLPKITPVVCMIACRNPTMWGNFNYFIAIASSEISCKVIIKIVRTRKIAIII